MSTTMNKIQSIFECAEFSTRPAEEFERIAKSRINYIICFTPRSGSSWLTELLTSTGTMGRPGEWFNLDNLAKILRSFPRCDIPTYADLLQCKQKTANGVFGLEASFFQLAMVEEAGRVDELFGPDLNYVYLWREDFVAQAVSLYRAASTGYFHSVQKLGDDLARKLEELPYDAAAIEEWALHILQQEYGFEAMFRERNINPLRLTYEALAEAPDTLVRAIADHIGVADEPADAESRHAKISGDTSQDWGRRFRKDRAGFVKTWTRDRGKVAAW